MAKKKVIKKKVGEVKDIILESNEDSVKEAPVEEVKKKWVETPAEETPAEEVDTKISAEEVNAKVFMDISNLEEAFAFYGFQYSSAMGLIDLAKKLGVDYVDGYTLKQVLTQVK